MTFLKEYSGVYPTICALNPEWSKEIIPNLATILASIRGALLVKTRWVTYKGLPHPVIRQVAIEIGYDRSPKQRQIILQRDRHLNRWETIWGMRHGSEVQLIFCSVCSKLYVLVKMHRAAVGEGTVRKSFICSGQLCSSLLTEALHLLTVIQSYTSLPPYVHKYSLSSYVYIPNKSQVISWLWLPAKKSFCITIPSLHTPEELSGIST
jgi:hypothetical protein